jgi:signal transduction histidine kinase
METADYLYKEVLNNTRCLVISLNAGNVVFELECPWGEWSVDAIRVGSPLPEPLRAVMDTAPRGRQTTFFPFIYLDESQVVDVHVCSHGLCRKVILRDVSEVHRAELKYQQKAHEVSLLLEKQSELNRQLEIQRAELERANQAKSQFIASMSHEFRTPITSIMGHADRLARTASDPSPPAAIQRASWHLLTLVENLLEEARQGEGTVHLNLARVDLDAVMQDMNALFGEQARSKGLELTIGPTPDNAVLESDELRLRQVLINLLGNAIRYTKKGRVELSTQSTDDRLEFRVTDSGPGISASDQERVFKPFMRLDESVQTGAGLGLSISSYLVDAMGGQIELDSEPGQGSTFRFSLPACGEGTPPAARDLAGLNVLLVEDDPDTLAILELFLADRDIRVRSAFTSSQALALAGEQDFDLVITDLHLEEESGADLLWAVRALQPACKTMLCTGSGTSSDWRASYGACADDFLMKPIQPDNLHAAIERVLMEED